MASLSMKRLQNKVNEIAEELDGLDTNEKLAQARNLARQDKELYGLFLEIVDDMLTWRWNRDMSESIKRFLEN